MVSGWSCYRSRDKCHSPWFILVVMMRQVKVILTHYDSARSVRVSLLKLSHRTTTKQQNNKISPPAPWTCTSHNWRLSLYTLHLHLHFATNVWIKWMYFVLEFILITHAMENYLNELNFTFLGVLAFLSFGVWTCPLIIYFPTFSPWYFIPLSWPVVFRSFYDFEYFCQKCLIHNVFPQWGVCLRFKFLVCT